jgi:Tfp pilus assembly pilus retraction ATPase PilT
VQKATAQGALTTWISVLWDQQGTDLQLVGGSPLIRKGGQLLRVETERVMTEAEITAVVQSALDDDQWAALHLEREVDFALARENKPRLAEMPSSIARIVALSLALHIIPEDIPSFDSVGMSESVRSLAQLPQRLGPVDRSHRLGKSTSMAALMDWNNVNRACHILTD